jgi:hypothetical protein
MSPQAAVGRVYSSAAENGFTANDVDQLLFTQISKPSIAIAAERCGARGRMCPFRDASAHARPLL